MKINKKTKSILTIFIVITILILSILYFGDGNFLAISSGFSTLSLGSQNFQSNDPVIGGQAWLLTVSQNGAGQSAYGTFTAKDGSTTSNEFSIETSLDKNYATYIITNQNTPITHFDYTTTIYNPFGSRGGCNPDVWSSYYKPSNSLTVYCYKKSTSAVLGSISSPNINFESSIDVISGGSTETCKVSNFASSSCTSSGGRFTASWIGSLVSGQSAPTASGQNIIAIYQTNTGGWKTADSNAYNNWKTADSNIHSCLNSEQSTNCFVKANQFEQNLLGGKAFTSSGGNVAITSGSSTSGQIKMDLPTQIQFPVITMRIKASFVGINIPVGIPKIVSVSTQKFTTGSSGIITVNVRNDGTGTGNFDISASCTNGFVQSGNALRISSLAKGSSSTVYLPITSNVVTGDLSGSCKITAIDVNNPNNIDTKSLTVTSSALAICASGDKRISGNTIEICEGNSWKLLSACENTKVAQYVGSEIQCVDKEVASSSSTILNSIKGFFSKLFSGISNIRDIFYYIRIIAVVIASLYASLISRNFFSKLINNKSDKWIVIILTILVGVGVAIVGYLILLTALFWWIIIGYLVFVIILNFTPFGRAISVLRRR